MNKKNYLNEFSASAVSLLGVDRAIWSRIRNTPEGTRILRAAIALIIGPIVFFSSYFSALGIIGVTTVYAFLIAGFFTLGLAVIDQMMFCAWVENRLEQQSPLLRYLRRIGIPALLVGMTILGLPGWLGKDTDTGVAQAINAKFLELKQNSLQYIALNAEIETLKAEKAELAQIEAKVLKLNSEIAAEKTNMKDQEEGNLLRDGSTARKGPGAQFRHHLNMINEKTQQVTDLEVRSAILKSRLSVVDTKKLEFKKLEDDLEKQAVDQIGSGIAVKLGLLWDRIMAGGVMLGLTAIVYFITALIVEAIVYLALSQAPPVNVAQILGRRTDTAGAKLHALALEERSDVMADIPVVKARFLSGHSKSPHLTIVSSAATTSGAAVPNTDPETT